MSINNSKKMKDWETSQLDMLRRSLKESYGIEADRKEAIRLILYT